MQEMQVQYLSQEDPPGEGNGNLLQFLIWRILWTEEPGGLQSIGSQRVRHDWTTFTFFHLFKVSIDGNPSNAQNRPRYHRHYIL